VDATLKKAVAAAGRADPNPVQDLGFMYNRTVEDPDGYVWEIMWMDASAAPPTPEARDWRGPFRGQGASGSLRPPSRRKKA